MLLEILNRVDQQLKAMGKEFIQLTGNDDNAFEFNKRGGVGAIGVTANVAAKLSSDFQKACTQNISKASELDKLLTTTSFITYLLKAILHQLNMLPHY